MFCSNCGKTLKADDITCPYCKMPVGESRFDADRGYTGAQSKIYPGQAMRVSGAYANHYAAQFAVESDSRAEEKESDADCGYRAVPGAGISGYGEDDDREPLYNSDEDTQTPPAGYEETGDGEEVEDEEEEESRVLPFRFRFPRREKEDSPEQEDEDGPDADSDELTDDELNSIKADISAPETPAAGISEGVRSFMSGLREEYDRKLEAEKRKAEKTKRARAEDGDEIEDFDFELPEDEPERVKAPAKKKKAAEKAQKPEKAPKPEKAKKAVKAARPEADEDSEAEEESEETEKNISAGFAAVRRLFSGRKKQEEDFESFDIDEETEAESEEDIFGDEDEAEEKPVRREKKSRAERRKAREEARIAEEEAEAGDEDETPEEADDEAEDEAGEREDDDFADEFDDEMIGASLRREKRLKLLKVILGALLIVALGLAVFVGINYLKTETQTAPIEHVTLELWNQGIELMQSRVSSGYRKKMLAMYDKDDASTFAEVSIAMTADLDTLADLMPENPDINDSRFINALKAIQESINNCLSNDVLAISDTTKTNSSKEAESEERWQIVRDLVTQLTRCTNTGMLDAIIKGERVELIAQATPEPDPTPTPMPYTALAKGSTGTQVVQLQTRLSELGYLTDTVDGSYGNKTKTAVQKFQQAAGIKADGIASVETQIALFAEDAPKAK